MQSIIAATSHNLRRLTHFSGREGRTSFWLYAAAVYIIMQVAAMLAMIPLMIVLFRANPADPPNIASDMIAFLWVGATFLLLHIGLLAAAAVRRLHDRGLSGWLILLPAPFLIWGWSWMGEWMQMIAEPEAGFDFGLIQTVLISNIGAYATLVLLAVLLALRGQDKPNRFGPPVDVERD